MYSHAILVDSTLRNTGSKIPIIPIPTTPKVKSTESQTRTRKKKTPTPAIQAPKLYRRKCFVLNLWSPMDSAQMLIKVILAIE